jgi:hypothetical protein
MLLYHTQLGIAEAVGSSQWLGSSCHGSRGCGFVWVLDHWQRHMAGIG